MNPNLPQLFKSGAMNYLLSNIWWIVPLMLIVMVGFYDVFINRRHAITHNFPVVGHLRYLLERVGPELRQYIVANNREELPFNRSQRTWIYTSSKKINNYRGFGSDQDQSATNYLFLKNQMFPFRMPDGHPNLSDPYFLPCAKVMGIHHGRRRPFRPRSVVNISAMSFGSLSAKAVESINRGSHAAGAYHNTGEGGLSPYHSTGADVVFQFGTGYFGVRDDEGNFSMPKLKKLVEDHPFVRAIEIKLSQGAKPGKGGVLPAAKITPEIAAIRHVPMGKDVISPSFHSAFSSLEEMLDFIENIAEETGLPVGIKSAVGKLDMWEELAALMVNTGKGADFIAIDGGEGGTGAAPPSFANHVSLPFVYAFSDVYKIFQKQGLSDHLVFIGAGKLGLPAQAIMAFALGCDIINTAREPMMAIGCIQAQKCHTNGCPAGVATQNKWLQAGIDVEDKAIRMSNYLTILRKEMLEITHSTGYEHPCQLHMEDVRMNTSDSYQTRSLKEIFGYQKSVVRFESMADLLNCPHLGSAKAKASVLVD